MDKVDIKKFDKEKDTRAEEDKKELEEGQTSLNAMKELEKKPAVALKVESEKDDIPLDIPPPSFTPRVSDEELKASGVDPAKVKRVVANLGTKQKPLPAAREIDTTGFNTPKDFIKPITTHSEKHKGALQWEKISTCERVSITYRLKVFGGWIVKVIPLNKTNIQLIFIRDPGYAWVI